MSLERLSQRENDHTQRARPGRAALLCAELEHLPDGRPLHQMYRENRESLEDSLGRLRVAR